MTQNQFALPTYDVIIDTNAIWSKDERSAISPTFKQAWEAVTKLTTLHLFVPDIVRGERVEQLVNLANDALQKAKNSLDFLHKISGISPVSTPSLNNVRRAIEKRFDDEVRGLKGTITPTPCDRIDWQEVIEHALKRVAPFEPAKKNDKGEKIDSEKGFRNRLILECLRHVVASKREHAIAFIGKDALLRDAISLHFKEGTLSCYEDVESFKRALVASQELGNTRLGERVAQKAPIVFYDPMDPACFYTSCHIYDELRQIEDLDTYPWRAHRFYLMQLNVARGNPPLLGYGEDGLGANRYAAHSMEKVWHNRTDLADYRDGRTHWKTAFSLVRQFEHVRRDTFDLLATMVRVSPWEVVWSCICDRESNFSDPVPPEPV
jgi:hypothetical protein